MVDGWQVGPRLNKDRERFPPNNLLLMLAGAGLPLLQELCKDAHHLRLKLLQKFDDTIAVLHTHAIAGTLGGILTGLFAEPRHNYLFYGGYNRYVGLFYGLQMGIAKTGFRQIGIQLLGILFVVLLNVISTSLICLLIRIIVPLRMSEEDMQIGDEAAHGEEAYAIWGQGDKLENSSSKYRSSLHDDVGGATKKKCAGQIVMI